MKKLEKRTKVYLLDRTKIADPVNFSSWKDFLPKERWEKTVRPVREEDRKTELAAWLSGISGYKGKKNGKALKESFFEWEYDGYRIAVCEEKDGEPELVVCSRTIDNCFL